MRLTKMNVGFFMADIKPFEVAIENEKGTLFGEIPNKLGQLEDIETELGVDLITLFKALKNGIAIKDEPLQNYPCSLNHNDIGWLLFVRTDGVLGAYYLKDYGKTWALTKEELL